MDRKSAARVLRANSATGSGDLDPGCSATDDDEGEQAGAFLGISLDFRLLESKQDLAAQDRRVVNRLDASGMGLPVTVSEVRMLGPCREDEIVERYPQFSSQDLPRPLIDPVTLARMTETFCCRLTIARIGDAISAGDSAAVAT